MIGRADIEGSKSYVAMNAWQPQASFPCVYFSDTSFFKLRTEGKGQASFSPFGQREVSVLTELALGHLRYHLTDVPPQSNSPPHNVLGANHGRAEPARLIREIGPEGPNFA